VTLEDHLGDIIRKARAMSGISTAAASKAAGISEAELSALEETGFARWGETPGEPNRESPLPASGSRGRSPHQHKINFATLAPLIGLNAAKLEGIANNWLPTEKDLGAWRELRCFTTTAGGMAVNCYLIWDEVSREAALFDTGWDAKPVLDCIAENQLVLRHIFITHTHHDHVAALGAIREAFPKAKVHSGSKNAPVDQRNRANDFIHLGSLRITNRDTPGHAEDGVTYIVGNWQEDAPHVAMVGDAIFAGSIGRGNQSWDLAKQKIREQILSLPPETLICPGHGPLTTVAEEKEHNPFF
jgi:glyoxylase-like metal-dependent hydrolase (beta-lactamase superfamily II)